VPNYREIDRDPRWLEWLTRPDPLSGYPRQRLLDDAIVQGNAARVIAFFRGFQREAAAGHHEQRPQQAAGGKPVYLHSQIKELAAQRRRGQIDDATWAAWQKELVTVAKEGRVFGAIGPALR